jgi:hypothetical protein
VQINLEQDMSRVIRFFSPFSAFVILLVATCSVSLADHHLKKLVDPSGTWRWSDSSAGYEVKNVLRLQFDEEKGLTGTYEGHSPKRVAIKQGKATGNKVSLVIEYNHEAVGDLKISLDGTIDQNTMNIQSKWTGGHVGSSKYKGKRGVLAEDVVGKWTLSFVDTQGTPGKAELEMKSMSGKLSGFWRGSDGEDIELKSAQIKANELRVKFETKYNGSDLYIAIEGRPYGNKMKGLIEYEIDGNFGDFDFDAGRAK